MTTIFPAILLSILSSFGFQSAVHELLPVLRVAGTLNLNFRDGGFDTFQIVLREFDCSGADVFFEAVQFRSARNRHDPRLLGQQPCKRDLCRRRLLAGCNAGYDIDQGVIGLAGIRREARHGITEVGAVELRVFVDRTGQKALAEWTEGNKADLKFFQRRQDFLFWLPPPQGVFALDSGDRLNGMSTANSLCWWVALKLSSILTFDATNIDYRDEQSAKRADISNLNYRTRWRVQHRVNFFDMICHFSNLNCRNQG